MEDRVLNKTLQGPNLGMREAVLLVTDTPGLKTHFRDIDPINRI